MTAGEAGTRERKGEDERCWARWGRGDSGWVFVSGTGEDEKTTLVTVIVMGGKEED